MKIFIIYLVIYCLNFAFLNKFVLILQIFLDNLFLYPYLTVYIIYLYHKMFKLKRSFKSSYSFKEQ